MQKKYDIATRLSHSDYRAPDGFSAFPPPVYHASTVLFENTAALRGDNGFTPNYVYGLHNTPTTKTLESRLAEIEGAKHGLLAPSGLAAITLVNLSMLKTGEGVLVPENIYAPNRAMCDWMESDLGITVDYYDPMIGADIKKHIKDNTRLIWAETPGSITMEVPDLPAIHHVAKAANIPVAVDSTWGAGIAFRGLDNSADIVVHALTKYQSGGSDVLMGAVLVNDDDLHTRLRNAHLRFGMGIGPDDAYLILRSLSSMKVRFDAHDASARKIATWLDARPEIGTLLHPAFPSCPGHDVWKRDFTGAGGLFSVIFNAAYTQAQVHAFVDKLTLFKIGFSWGGSHSLCVPYIVNNARSDWRAQGELVRFNIGLEDADDLIADIEQAFEALQK